MAATINASPATPPTTPPAIAPVFDLLVSPVATGVADEDAPPVGNTVTVTGSDGSTGIGDSAVVLISLVGDQPGGGLVAIVLDPASSPHARKLTPYKFSKKFALYKYVTQ